MMAERRDHPSGRPAEADGGARPVRRGDHRHDGRADRPAAIRHHPQDELLLDFATGAQPAALALAVAGHLDFCRACRTMVADLEILGGELIRGMESADLAEGAPEACLARLDDAEPHRGHRSPRALPCAAVPASLRRHLDRGLADLPWRSVGGFFDEVRLPPLSAGYRVSMLRVAAGRHVPEHGHDGNEFMLVLKGGYRSGGRHYRIGDFAACDGSEEHTPIADDGEDCVCLLVLDGPLAFRDADGLRIGPLLTM